MQIPEPWCLPLFLGGKKGAWVEGFAPPGVMKKLIVSCMKALVPLSFEIERWAIRIQSGLRRG